MIAALPQHDALQTHEAETCLLGTMMSENDRIDAVADLVRGDDFSVPFYGYIFDLIVSERSKGRAANPVTLNPMLASHENYTSIGGHKFLAGLTGMSAMLIRPLDAARQIAEMAARRRMIEGLREALSQASDPAFSLESVMDAADASLTLSITRNTGITETTGGNAMAGLLASFNEPMRGVTSTIIGSLDKLLGPIRPKQLVIMAGRPGMGKTATALSYSLGVAQGGQGVLFVSLEMSSEELSARMAADLSFNGTDGVSLDTILAEHKGMKATRAVSDAEAALRDMPFHIIDAGSLAIGRLNMIVRRYKRRLAARGETLGLVVVDYLQLLRTDDKSRSNYEAVSEISRSLKAMAKDNDVGVLALAQLSREVEKRTDKVPQLADLRDSGQIEQDADGVLFLVRDEYYLRVNEPEPHSAERAAWQQAMDECEGKIDFVCAKRRNGRTGRAQGQFHGMYQAVRG